MSKKADDKTAEKVERRIVCAAVSEYAAGGSAGGGAGRQ